MLQVCLNGARIQPWSPEGLAAAAAEAVAAGAEDIHLHPKTRDGEDTMDPAHVAAAIVAVRAAVPGIPVGVTTGAWAVPDPAQRAHLVRSWTVRPDHASVNWHEAGAATVAAALLEQDIGIEAGIYSATDAAERFLTWSLSQHWSLSQRWSQFRRGSESRRGSQSQRALRILAEVTDTDAATAPDTAIDLLSTLEPTNLPILLHGEEAGAWPVLRVAITRGLHARIGLEDVLHLPDGTPTTSNAALIRAARALQPPR